MGLVKGSYKENLNYLDFLFYLWHFILFSAIWIVCYLFSVFKCNDSAVY